MTSSKIFILQYNAEWIKLADQKAAAILAFYGILLTIIASNVNDITAILTQQPLILWLSVPAVILTIVSILFCILCLKPTLGSKTSKSLIYFKGISSFSNLKEFSAEISENRISASIDEQIYTTAKICSTKYAKLNVSIYSLFGTIIFLLLILLILIKISL